MRCNDQLMPIRWLRAVALLVALGGSGCATLPPNAGQDPRDPWEKVNRNVFAFNEGFDAAILKPVAELYAKLPEGVRDCFSNAFFNLRGPSTAINNALQGKPSEAASDVGRFFINTTVGLVGCFDPASELGLERHREDFGQTLGVWGFEPGPFVMLPLLGPSSVRDAVGILAVEPFLDLNFYIDFPARRVRHPGAAHRQRARRAAAGGPADQRGGTGQVQLYPGRLPPAASKPGVRRQPAAPA